MELEALLRRLRDAGGSDLWLQAGHPPRMKVHGELMPEDQPPLRPPELRQLLEAAGLHRSMNRRGGLFATAISVAGAGRFRLRARDSASGATIEVHAVPSPLPEPESLGLSGSSGYVDALRERRSGLVLIAGPRGSGRSSTVAFLIDQLASEPGQHVYTIEDPIEFVHHSEGCLVTQRQVGIHVTSFEQALEDALRAGADIVSLGTLDGASKIEGALRLADRGARVLATVDSAPTILDLRRQLLGHFAPDRRDELREWIARHLILAHTRVLVADAAGSGQVAAGETLYDKRAGRPVFAAPTDDEFNSAFPTNARPSNVPLNSSLLTLYYRKQITLQPALRVCHDPDLLQECINRGTGQWRQPSPKEKPSALADAQQGVRGFLEGTEGTAYEDEGGLMEHVSLLERVAPEWLEQELRRSKVAIEAKWVVMTCVRTPALRETLQKILG